MKRRLATLVLLASTTPLAAQWLTLPTPGIPRTAGGEPDLSAPAPRAADGHPDLSGLWVAVDVTGDLLDPARVQEWARTLMTEREAGFFEADPRFQCLPTGPAYLALTGANNGARRIVQTPTVIAILNADLNYRQIFTDGRELEPDPLPTWTGYSVGRWDGDTLVVESNGYNDRTWLHTRGLPHTEGLRMTERYHRSDFGHIQVDATYDDPGTFDSPLHAVIRMEFVADDEMLENRLQRVLRGTQSLGRRHLRCRRKGRGRRTGDSGQIRRYVRRILVATSDQARSHAGGRCAVPAEDSALYAKCKHRDREIAARCAIRNRVRVQLWPWVHLHSRRRGYCDRGLRGSCFGRMGLHARALTTWGD